MEACLALLYVKRKEVIPVVLFGNDRRCEGIIQGLGLLVRSGRRTAGDMLQKD